MLGYVHDPCVNMLSALLPKAEQKSVWKRARLDHPSLGPSPQTALLVSPFPYLQSELHC